MPKIINSFSGANEFLSNFYPCEIFYLDQMFKTTEAAFQAAKTTDHQQRLAIADADTPGQAKRLGRRVDLRPDWEEIKVQVMLDILRLKFTKGSELARRLDDTGNAILVEGTTWHDQYWGVCKCDTHKGHGRNMLGQLLMKVREENRRGTSTMTILHTESRPDWLVGGPYTTAERQ